MNILLVLNNKNVQNLRVMVSLNEGKVRRRVTSLLRADRNKEAFEVLKRQANVRAYVPYGVKPSVKPEFTLFEDML